MESILKKWFSDSNSYRENVVMFRDFEDLTNILFEGGFEFYDKVYDTHSTIIYDKKDKCFYINNKKESDFKYVLNWYANKLLNGFFITKEWKSSLKIL